MIVLAAVCFLFWVILPVQFAFLVSLRSKILTKTRCIPSLVTEFFFSCTGKIVMIRWRISKQLPLFTFCTCAIAISRLVQQLHNILSPDCQVLLQTERRLKILCHARTKYGCRGSAIVEWLFRLGYRGLLGGCSLCVCAYRKDLQPRNQRAKYNRIGWQ